MAFMTITAKKTGTCKRCGGAIEIGQRIRWARYGGSYHLAAECPASQAQQQQQDGEQTQAPTVQSELARRTAGWQEPAPVMTDAARTRYNRSQRRYTTNYEQQAERAMEQAMERADSIA